MSLSEVLILLLPSRPEKPVCQLFEGQNCLDTPQIRASQTPPLFNAVFLNEQACVLIMDRWRLCQLEGIGCSSDGAGMAGRSQEHETAQDRRKKSECPKCKREGGTDSGRHSLLKTCTTHC